MIHDNELHLRRLAIQIVAQLPENRKDALRVLALSENLVDGFMCPRSEESDTPKISLV